MTQTRPKLELAQLCERPPGNNCSYPTVEPKYTDKTVILYSASRTVDHGKSVADWLVKRNEPSNTDSDILKAHK